MSGEVEKCPILHVRLKFDVFTLGQIKKNIFSLASQHDAGICLKSPAFKSFLSLTKLLKIKMK